MANVKATAGKTAEYLVEYLGEVLVSNEIDPLFASYAMEHTFGEGIHKAIDGFIKFASEPDNDIDADGIRFTLAHDMVGGLNQDKLMMPRVSEYGKYSK